MKVIGITGGVGSGKSAVLTLLKRICSCRIMMADDIANQLKQPGQSCYQPVVALLGEEILSEDGTIDNRKMAARVFADQALLRQVNDIIHPAVKEYILQEIQAERERGEIDFLFLEAALLIEAGYRPILDELWYVYADEQTRILRLMDSRGYTVEKARGIIASQLSEQEYRANCDWVLDNSGSMAETERKLQEYIDFLRESC
ncbi:MAG: dephospho-CoA kinase [Lachnospiraceae bacterium]|nr:dephospho-CoA kinase [Lachnospiraceae bacterium]